MDNKEKMDELFDRYLNNQCTEEEIIRLLDYFKTENDNGLLTGLVRYEMERRDEVEAVPYDASDISLLKNVDRRLKETIAERRLKEKKRIQKLLRYSLSVAAGVALLGLIGLFFQHQKDSGIVEDKKYGYKNDVLPGSEKALLYSETGKELVLNDKTRKEYSNHYTPDGLLMIQHKALIGGGKRLTLKTPKGGTYKVVLADGSRIWLNALSELDYPLSFSGADREVNLKGEAFFDIKASSSEPFRINVEGKVVEVLGTSFNIKSYGDALETTLVEGKVKLIHGDKQVLLAPGQEASIDKEKEMAVKQVSLPDGIAWVKGDFYFESARITEVMEDIERWYNVEVSYVGEIPLTRFTGAVSRNAHLAEVLEMLKTVSGAKFKIDKRKLYVDFGLK